MMSSSSNNPILTLDELIRLAPPPPPKGIPTTAEIEEHKQFKSKVKAFLISNASQGHNSDLSYNSIMKKVKASRRQQVVPTRTKEEPQPKSKGKKDPPIKPTNDGLDDWYDDSSFSSSSEEEAVAAYSQFKGRDRWLKKNSLSKSKKNETTKKKQSGYKQQVDYLCILDFEATCQRGGSIPKPQEIIEFPALLMNTKTGFIEDTFHYYIKPDVNPTLSQFCTELTGITQKMVDEQGIPLEEALRLHETWLDKHNLVNYDNSIVGNNSGGDGDKKKNRFLYVTAGDWDLKTCLPNQLAYHGRRCVPEVFDSWINVKWPFQKLYKTRKARGMISMLEALDMTFEGRHHSGIDDCRNLARICARMLKDGWIPQSTGGSTVVGTHQFWKYQQLRQAPVLLEPPRDDQPFKTIILIRHGQSVGNITRGQERSNNPSLLDCGLTNEGVKQAAGITEILGPSWAESIQYVISSPLKRALHTALLGFPKISIQLHYGLCEIGDGIPENLARPMEENLKDLENEIRSRSDSARLEFESTKPAGWPTPTYKESHSKRIKNAFKWIYEERSEQVLAVVCHYNVIRTVIQAKKKGTVSPENAIPILCRLYSDGRLIPV